MPDLLDVLASYNRKERFHLVKQALGGFQVCGALKQALKEEDNSIEIPEKHFAAMDYHLDWIYASLYSYFGKQEDKGPFKNDRNIIKGSQEDIDFLIAYKDNGGIFHLIFLEAKGVTGWSNKQMDSKSARFKEILGQTASKWQIVPHFFLLSPRKPENLNVKSAWKWVELNIPLKDLEKVVKCDESGKAKKDGAYWKIKNEYPHN